MKQTDFPLVLGGISSPVWLDAVNQWLGLVLVTLSIILVIIRIWKTGRSND